MPIYVFYSHRNDVSKERKVTLLEIKNLKGDLIQCSDNYSFFHMS